MPMYQLQVSDSFHAEMQEFRAQLLDTALRAASVTQRGILLHLLTLGMAAARKDVPGAVSALQASGITMGRPPRSSGVGVYLDSGKVDIFTSSVLRNPAAIERVPEEYRFAVGVRCKAKLAERAAKLAAQPPIPAPKKKARK